MAQQITLNIENPSILPSLRKVLSMLNGVTVVRTPKVSAKKERTCHLDKAIVSAKRDPLFATNDIDELMNALAK